MRFRSKQVYSHEFARYVRFGEEDTSTSILVGEYRRRKRGRIRSVPVFAHLDCAQWDIDGIAQQLYAEANGWVEPLPLLPVYEPRFARMFADYMTLLDSPVAGLGIE